MEDVSGAPIPTTSLQSSLRNALFMIQALVCAGSEAEVHDTLHGGAAVALGPLRAAACAGRSIPMPQTCTASVYYRVVPIPD